MKQSVLTRYRVMAYVTGVLLVLLTLGCIGKYVLDISGSTGFVTVVGIAHGWLYMVYLVCAFDLGYRAKIPVGRLLWVMLAGTVPTAAFFVERRLTQQLQPLVIRPESADDDDDADEAADAGVDAAGAGQSGTAVKA
jgi:integral membrane protein